jgi:tetratricopeptide (TPR) repeat protein
MPTKRRSQPAVRTHKRAAAPPQSKRSAAVKPAKPKKAPARPAKPKKAPAKPAKPKKAPARPAKPKKAPAKPAKLKKAPARPAKPKKAPAKPAKLKKAPAKPAKPKKAPAKPARPKKAAAGRAGSRALLSPIVGPSSHDQAVEAFERGFQALQQRQYGKAAGFLGAVLDNFTDEKDLQERARVYLVICERQAAREAKPRSFEDRLHAATVIVNRGAFDEALALLRKLENDEPDNDFVHYLLSVVYTAVGNAEQALAHLRKAIELAPENQFRAAQDPDLEPLRQDGALAALTGELTRRRRPAAKKR